MSGIKLVMSLNYGGPKHDMTVGYAPGGATCYSQKSRSVEPKPMLRIANRHLLESGFSVGSKILVEFGTGVITITLKDDPQACGVRTPMPIRPHAVQASRFALEETGMLQAVPSVEELAA